MLTLIVVCVVLTVLALASWILRPYPTYSKNQEVPDLRVAHLPVKEQERLMRKAKQERRRNHEREFNYMQKEFYLEQRAEAWKRGEPGKAQKVSPLRINRRYY